MVELDVDLCRISEATADHSPGITDIYNYYVSQSIFTFDLDEKPVSYMYQLISELRHRYPIYVAASGDLVVGYIYLSPFSRRGGYHHLGELSLYLRPDYCGRGIGHKLFARLVEKAKEREFKNIMAFVVDENVRMAGFLKRLGFQCSGRIVNAGYKFGRFVNLDIFQTFI